MKFEELETDQFETWDSYVAAHELGTIFQTTSWLSSFEGIVKVLVTRIKGRICGGLAFIVSRRFGCLGIHNLPYTPVSGPLFGDLSDDRHMKSTKQYYIFIKELLGQLPYGHVEFCLHEKLRNTLPYKWSGFTDETSMTYKISSASKQAYMQAIDSNKRREINKFEKCLVSGELVIDENISNSEIMDLQAQTGIDRGFEIHKKVLVKILENSAGNRYTIGLRTMDGVLFSCGVFLFDRLAVYNLINASISIEHPVFKNSNVYTLHRGISKALELEKIFDFEGSSIEGVENFYRRLGGVQYQMVRVKRSRNLLFLGARVIQQIKREVF